MHNDSGRVAAVAELISLIAAVVIGTYTRHGR